ncbi:MAG TPA: hypothetical protein VLA16_19795 [Ideonella sp.]|nr:hypothetical protein [Ideonella sp.]
MRILTTLATLLAAAAIAGCTSAPIQNVSDATVVSPAGKPLSEEQVKTAIIRAGLALGWQMKEAGPGKIAGSLALRKHVAEVEIPYSATTYSITYKSSVNLDENSGMIHKNYNGWIQNLTKGINAQLLAS